LISFLVKLWEYIVIALRAISENKMRAILTTVGIIIGVLTVVSVASIIAGLNQGFADQIANLGSNTLYVQKYPWVAGEDWFKYRNRPDITLKDAEYIHKHMKLAEAVSPTTGTRRNVKYQNNTLEDITISGATVESESIENYNITSGRYFTPLEIEKDKNFAIIGYEVQEKLFEEHNPLGKKIRIGNIPYTVVGVLEKRGSIFGYSLDSEIIVPLGSIFRNFGFHRSIQIQVKVADAQDLDAARDELRFLMRVSRRLKPDEEDNFSINQQEMLTDMYKRLTGGLYTAAIGIGTLSLLVGGIGIMNIMLVSVAERRKEIGIRKALGAKRRTISFQFIIESVIICSVGGIIAIFLSFLLSIFIDKVTPFPSSVPLWSVLMGLGFSTFVGLFFGIYPAQRAARLDPIECLRYE
jgi:putative ABC transport system permease protein